MKEDALANTPPSPSVVTAPVDRASSAEDLPSQQLDRAGPRAAEAKRKKEHDTGDRTSASPPRRKKKDACETSSAPAPSSSSEEYAYAQIASVYEGDGNLPPLPLEDVLDYLRKMRGCNRPEAKTRKLFPDTAPLVETLTRIAKHPNFSNRAMQARLGRLLAILA
jgi:hypothetical protein